MDVSKLIAVGCLTRALRFLQDRSQLVSEAHECTVWTDFADMAASNTLETAIEEVRHEISAERARCRSARAVEFLKEQHAAKDESVPRHRDFSLCTQCRKRNCLACDGGDCRCTCTLDLDVPMKRSRRSLEAAR